jgi:hypothetical protein
MIGINQQPLEIPISNPQTKYTCHNELTCDIRKNAIPAVRPVIVTRSRGPYLSANFPARIARTPLTNIFIELAADRVPLSQPNAVVSGIRNMPKE